MKVLKANNRDLDIRVCDCHYELVSGKTWTAYPAERKGALRKWRFKCWVDGKAFLIHRLIMGLPKGFVDHIDGDTQNNQCSNLRVTNQTKNNFNQHGAKKGSKSGFKGVYWHKRAQKWAAECVYNRKKHYLGLFENANEAAKAYNIKALELDSEFAYLNEVESEGAVCAHGFSILLGIPCPQCVQDIGSMVESTYE